MWHARVIPRSALGLRPGFGFERRGFERLVEALWDGFALPAAPAPVFAPALDVVETEAEIRVTAELPGLEERDFEVSVHGDVLSIRGEKRGERAEERRGGRHVESVCGSFQRSIRLPFEPAAEGVKAAYRRGVLEITVPRPAEAGPQIRTIPVTS